MAQRSVFSITSLGDAEPAYGPIFPLDLYSTPQQVSVQAVVAASETPPTFTVEYTLDNVFATGYVPANGTWFPITALQDKTANTYVSLASLTNTPLPVAALRAFLTDASDAGTVTFTFIQDGGGY